MYTFKELAVAHADSAECLLDENFRFLTEHPAVVPVFVNLLFQSIEISIKYACVESGVYKLEDARKVKNGHWIDELAKLAFEKLGFDSFDPIIDALTQENKGQNSKKIIREMICGNDFAETRKAYASRRLSYGEVFGGDYAIIQGNLDIWVAAVKETAENLDTAVEIFSQWKASVSTSKHYGIFYKIFK